MNTLTHITGEQWEFRCAESAGRACWRWRRRDAGGHVIRDFGDWFPSLKAALEDAARYGFVYEPTALKRA